MLMKRFLQKNGTKMALNQSLRYSAVSQTQARPLMTLFKNQR